MFQTWQLQQAENEFSLVVESAISNGPQIITQHGVEVAVVLSFAEYERMVASRQGLAEFFHESPLVGVDLDLTRDNSEARSDVQL